MKHTPVAIKFPKKTVQYCRICNVVYPCLGAQLHAIEKGKIKKGDIGEHPRTAA